jgi:hypothetical protein
MPSAPPLPRNRRLLLAFDGRDVTRTLLNAALRGCVHLTSHLDILVINPPQAPTFLLAVLLLQLEHSGIDYRLADREGEFGRELVRQLQRYREPATVIVPDLAALRAAQPDLVEQLEATGHNFLSLSDLS